jgi:DNA-binding SARP family transcriptional activator
VTGAEPGSVTLQLLDGLRVVFSNGDRVCVPEGSKRLLTFVALHGRRVERCHAAGVLWPRVDGPRAAGNLRSAVWRLRAAGIDILSTDNRALYLRPHVEVDLDSVFDWAKRLEAGKPEPNDVVLRPLTLQALDLLPGWYDDWVLLERERLRQMLLRAIDTLASMLVKAERCGEAIEAALTAVSFEPLRESAQRALIQAHLAEGNRCEALRSYAIYEDLLVRELGVRPSVELRELVHESLPWSTPCTRRP